ncbi:MAG: phage head closure protein [Lactobacillaceae bacterium]|jgi:SPP1 family predicted phage head-tail adaptor|nr:phage head closure protein [Lactobacillaceae bacterium]
MRFDSVIYLLKLETVEDDIGQAKRVVTAKQKVYANKFSLNFREFYEAGQQGLRADAQYQINTVDYQNQQIVLIDGEQYSVINVDTRGERSILTLSKKISDFVNLGELND